MKNAIQTKGQSSVLLCSYITATLIVDVEVYLKVLDALNTEGTATLRINNPVTSQDAEGLQRIAIRCDDRSQHTLRTTITDTNIVDGKCELSLIKA